MYENIEIPERYPLGHHFYSFVFDHQMRLARRRKFGQSGPRVGDHWMSSGCVQALLVDDRG
jgi:hypothetical protein